MHTRCIVIENKNQVQKRDPFFTRLCEVENDIIKMESFDPDQKGISYSFGPIIVPSENEYD